MAFTFDSTVGGASANSYVAVSSATDYFGGRLDVAEWTAAATATQQAALAMATIRLEAEQYVGSPTNSTQRLAWPRYSVRDRRYTESSMPGTYSAIYGVSVYASDTIPEPVFEACCELALLYLKDNTAQADTGLEGFQRVIIGGAIDVTPNHNHKAGALPAHVLRLLRGLRVSTGGAVPVVRG